MCKYKLCLPADGDGEYQVSENETGSGGKLSDAQTMPIEFLKSR